MKAKEIVGNIQAKIAACDRAGCRWFFKIRSRARIHPYDGEELEFSTCSWTVLEADSQAEALSAVNQLIVLGHGQMEDVHTGTQVCAFMEWPNQN